MPQTLSLNLVHIIFSTKDRQALVPDELSDPLYTYLAGAARQMDCECFRAGGMPNHVHLALRLAPTRAAAKVVSEIKTGSSIWMKQQGVTRFAWQRGYGLFSVSPADIGKLVRYIETQKAHHRKRSFEDEMRAFFAKYHVEFDERYVWD